LQTRGGKVVNPRAKKWGGCLGGEGFGLFSEPTGAGHKRVCPLQKKVGGKPKVTKAPKAVRHKKSWVRPVVKANGEPGGERGRPLGRKKEMGNSATGGNTNWGHKSRSEQKNCWPGGKQERGGQKPKLKRFKLGGGEEGGKNHWGGPTAVLGRATK